MPVYATTSTSLVFVMIPTRLLIRSCGWREVVLETANVTTLMMTTASAFHQPVLRLCSRLPMRFSRPFGAVTVSGVQRSSQPCDRSSPTS